MRRRDAHRPRWGQGRFLCADSGFTLIEVLVTVALIGIFMAVLIAASSGVRDSAGKARARVQFTQWAAAIEAFRSEYGHYPHFAPSHKVNGDTGANGGLGSEHLFHDILAGRRRDGRVPGPLAAAQNRRHIRFHSFAQSAFAQSAGRPELIQDALGNTDIVVLVDRNLDGRIDVTDYPALPAVSREGVLIGAPPFPPGGLLIPVAFYSAGPRATAANPEFIVSW